MSQKGIYSNTVIQSQSSHLCVLVLVYIVNATSAAQTAVYALHTYRESPNADREDNLRCMKIKLTAH